MTTHDVLIRTADGERYLYKHHDKIAAAVRDQDIARRPAMFIFHERRTDLARRVRCSRQRGGGGIVGGILVRRFSGHGHARAIDVHCAARSPFFLPHFPPPPLSPIDSGSGIKGEVTGMDCEEEKEIEEKSGKGS